ncbi:hypothetical protein JTP67_19665, partial [Streptomyces sp. S12]|nr:hypothetical protein [Streptomyces sp. S12]
PPPPPRPRPAPTPEPSVTPTPRPSVTPVRYPVHRPAARAERPTRGATSPLTFVLLITTPAVVAVAALRPR